MSKIVYNDCYGGFSLSHEAVLRYAEIKGIQLWLEEEESPFVGQKSYTYWLVDENGRGGVLSDEDFYGAGITERVRSNVLHDQLTLSSGLRDVDRTDPALIQVVEEMGAAANGEFASLAVAEIPTGSSYRIDEYDGLERVMTRDDYEWNIAP